MAIEELKRVSPSMSPNLISPDTPYLNTRGASRSEHVEGIFSAAPPMLFGSLAYALLYSRTLVAPHHPRPDPRDRAAALMIWLQGWCESWS